MSNWNQLATWYTGLVGQEGHKYHKVVIPEILKLIKPHESVLDIGCGTGVLAKNFKNYTGIDESPQMISEAKKLNKGKNFIQGSATNLSNLVPKKHDIGIFMLSIQDMDHLERVISESSKVCKSLIILMVHPSFRIPRQSGWGTDKDRKLTYRRVDRYLTQETIPLNTKVNDVTSYFYHRPLQKYTEELFKNGYQINHISEIADPKPEFNEFPLFLLLKATQY